MEQKTVSIPQRRVPVDVVIDAEVRSFVALRAKPGLLRRLVFDVFSKTCHRSLPQLSRAVEDHARGYFKTFELPTTRPTKHAPFSRVIIRSTIGT